MSWLKFSTAWLVCSVAVVGVGQDFELVESDGRVSGRVSMRSDSMRVYDGSGREYDFERDAYFDSLDGQFDGYVLPDVGRVVRFPVSGQGLMQIADLNSDRPRYFNSQRQIRPMRGGGVPAAGHRRPGTGRIGNGVPGGFSSLANYGRRPVMHGGGYCPPASAFLPPVFQAPFGYPAFGYQAFGPSLTVGVSYPGVVYPAVVVRPPLVQSIVLDSHLVARQALPPVTVNLFNSARREVQVRVVDRVSNRIQDLRIPPGGQTPLMVQRDTGGDRVQTVLTYGPDGSRFTREIRTSIPPPVRYELTVHEWRLQSVAIDRTGKSPNVIEDSRFQGRGLGRFALPPGDQVTGGTLDVIRNAVGAGNAGAVAPIIDHPGIADPLGPVSPMEKMLIEQRRAGRR